MEIKEKTSELLEEIRPTVERVLSLQDKFKELFDKGERDGSYVVNLEDSIIGCFDDIENAIRKLSWYRQVTVLTDILPSQETSFILKTKCDLKEGVGVIVNHKYLNTERKRPEIFQITGKRGEGEYMCVAQLVGVHISTPIPRGVKLMLITPNYHI